MTNLSKIYQNLSAVNNCKIAISGAINKKLEDCGKFEEQITSTTKFNQYPEYINKITSSSGTIYSNPNLYQCKQVNETGTWSGYLLSCDITTNIWTITDYLDETLQWNKFIRKPEVSGIYSGDCRVKIKWIFQDIPIIPKNGYFLVFHYGAKSAPRDWTYTYCEVEQCEQDNVHYIGEKVIIQQENETYTLHWYYSHYETEEEALVDADKYQQGEKDIPDPDNE